MKPTISTIPYGVSLGLRDASMAAAKFLSEERGLVLGREGINYLKSSVRMTVGTPITEIYTKAADLGKLSCFTMLDLGRVKDPPTILTNREIAIDGKYISKEMPSDFKNVWLNLSSFSRNDAYNGFLHITDTMQLASSVARGLLCMSYNDSPVWLTPMLRCWIIEMYSLCLTMRMKTLFDLNMEEYSLFRLLFAAYMAQMLDEEDSTKEVPPILYSCKFLYQDTGTMRTIDDRMEAISGVRAQVSPTMDLNIDKICKIMQEKGPARAKKLLKASSFYQFMSRSPSDSQSMLCSIDYPPYFVWMLLENLRGGKNPFFQSLIRFGDMKRTIVKFTNELISSRTFIDKVSR